MQNIAQAFKVMCNIAKTFKYNPQNNAKVKGKSHYCAWVLCKRNMQNFAKLR